MTAIQKHSSAPNTATQGAQSQASDGLVANPKVARRPSQWKRVTSETATPLAPTTPAPIIHIQDRTATDAWQDDSRFAIWLVVAIVALNVALVHFADSSTPAPKVSSIMVQQVTHASAMQTPVSGVDTPPVHMFSTPIEERRTIHHTSIESLDDNATFNINDISEPAPRAEPEND